MKHLIETPGLPGTVPVCSAATRCVIDEPPASMTAR
jgi:hypothetical protein